MSLCMAVSVVRRGLLSTVLMCHSGVLGHECDSNMIEILVFTLLLLHYNNTNKHNVVM